MQFVQAARRVGGKLVGSRATIAILLAAISLPFIAPAAVADYRIEIGDVLEISVAGIPELRQRLTVDMEGEVSLPIIGQVMAAGFEVSELRGKVQRLFAAKVLRRPQRGGVDAPTIVLPESITLAVVEYRPVYLSGDVAKPGELVFRPGLTVRKAIALAGGYDIMRGRNRDSLLEMARLRSEYERLWIQLAKQQILIRRIGAELGNKTTMDRAGLTDTPLGPLIKAKIEDLEVEQLHARLARYQGEKATLETAIDRTDGQIAFLVKTEENDKEGLALSNQELERVMKMHKKGLSTITQLNGARRNMLLQSTRQIQTLGHRSIIEKNRDELTLRLEQVDGQRKVDLLREHQDAEIKLATIRSSLRSVRDQLVYTGMARSQQTRDKSVPPKIEIFRKSDRLVADEDAAVLPGDVIEVTLQKDYLLGEAVGQ